MIELCIQAIGLAAPGLPNWNDAAPVLRGELPLLPSPLSSYAPQLLPPNERRRAQPSVRQAFRVAEEAVAGRDASQLSTVFSSSDGDLAILHRICSAFAQNSSVVSPTDFHNSVHNAAAGYWGIGTGSRAPSTTLAGHDQSFAAGLLEAALQVNAQQQPVLLVVFDVPAPEPLLQARVMACAASCALLLAPRADDAQALATLQLQLSADAETVLTDPALEAQRHGNPALRGLPLLRAVARREAGRVVLPCSGHRNLAVNLEF
jgi:hypothetical protein